MKIINTDVLSETINMIASNIFIVPKEYQKQLKNIIYVYFVELQII